MNAKPYIIIDMTTTEMELEGLLSACSIPCIRLATDDADTEAIRRKIEKLRVICQEQNIPLFLEDDYEIAKNLGLDGVHINKSNKDYENILKMVTDEFMIGIDCGYSKHVGIISAEMGASYISFKVPNINDKNSQINTDLFKWWHQTVEISLVAEGCNNSNQFREFSKISDFISISPKDWRSQVNFNQIIECLQ